MYRPTIRIALARYPTIAHHATRLREISELINRGDGGCTRQSRQFHARDLEKRVVRKNSGGGLRIEEHAKTCSIFAFGGNWNHMKLNPQSVRRAPRCLNCGVSNDGLVEFTNITTAAASGSNSRSSSTRLAHSAPAKESRPLHYLPGDQGCRQVQPTGSCRNEHDRNGRLLRPRASGAATKQPRRSPLHVRDQIDHQGW